MKRSAIFICAVSMATGIALATNRFYGDTSGKSPSGEYTAEAKSPANKNGNPEHPFQEDFTVTFKNTQSGKTLWTWHQQKDDASPVELIPTDDGYLVMQDASDEYRVFGTNGVSSKPVSAFASIPKNEQENFTDWTTAGVKWQQYSRQGFYTHDETTYFYLRTYWGHIFAISLPDGKETKKKDVLAGIEAQVVQETRAWIKVFDDEFFFKCPDCGGNHVKSKITESLFIIKKHKIQEGAAITEKALKKMDDNRNTDLKDYLDRLE